MAARLPKSGVVVPVSGTSPVCAVVPISGRNFLGNTPPQSPAVGVPVSALGVAVYGTATVPASGARGQISGARQLSDVRADGSPAVKDCLKCLRRAFLCICKVSSMRGAALRRVMLVLWHVDGSTTCVPAEATGSWLLASPNVVLLLRLARGVALWWPSCRGVFGQVKTEFSTSACKICNVSIEKLNYVYSITSISWAF